MLEEQEEGKEEYKTNPCIRVKVVWSEKPKQVHHNPSIPDVQIVAKTDFASICVELTLKKEVFTLELANPSLVKREIRKVSSQSLEFEKNPAKTPQWVMSTKDIEDEYEAERGDPENTKHNYEFLLKQQFTNVDLHYAYVMGYCSYNSIYRVSETRKIASFCYLRRYIEKELENTAIDRSESDDGRVTVSYKTFD